MGPMLPEQLNKINTKWNTDNHQQSKLITTKNEICNWEKFKNEEQKIKNINNNTNYLTYNDDDVVDSDRRSNPTLLMWKMLPSAAIKVVDTTQPLSTIFIKNINNTNILQTTTTENQEEEPEKQQEQEHTVYFEEQPFLKTTALEGDVKNNYTRRRRRGRLRLQQANHSDHSLTTTVTTTTENNNDTTINNNNNNNTAFTIINLDNNFRKTSLRNNIQEEEKHQQQTTQNQIQNQQHQQQQQQQNENKLNLFIKINDMLTKFTTLSLMLLLLVITSLSKFYRYVNIIINNTTTNTNNKRRRLAANINNNKNNLNLKLKLKINYKLNNYNNKINVKNYIFLIGLCVATTILPLNLVNAAKPFSNSQKHTNHNNNNLKHNDHGGHNGEGHLSSASSGAAVLTPLPPLLADGEGGGGGDGIGGGSSASSETEFIYQSSQSDENFDDDDKNSLYTNAETSTNNATGPNITVTKTPLFPPDLFTKEQLENGAVICHIIGVIYMFVALAIVCDEFFVPSLDVIIEKLGITDDVAGATFMAAGGSAPELFTSVIGVFVSFDDVGIGTIVGSAVFNILFVIGMCALFSKTILTLTWWPLFRDCSFYSLSLLILIYFFRDNLIYWWEALILFSIYMCYVGFMKWNQQVERCVKKVITKNKVTRVRSTDQLMPAGNAANSSETSMATQPGGSVTSRAASETRSGPAGSSSGATGNSSSGTTQTGAKFRHGLLQLMIHTIDPLHDGKVDEKATQLHAIASLKVLLDATKPQRGGATTSAANHVKINLKETTLADRPNGNIDTTLESPSLSARRPSWIEQRVKIQTRRFSTKFPINVDLKQGNEIEEPPEALSMAWPSTARKRLTYVLVAPLLFPLWLTLPDTRTPRGKQFYPVTFIGSILWIAAYSYLMVWWANVAGDTARIPPEVMGLTFLAAGTSIPDLITSVIVARKGFGDMAVSSSVGSNIFDVTVGLPIPWLLYGIIYDAPVEVNSVGMVCSITILFMMLLFVVMSIACFRWKMNKGLGFTMFLLYFVFVAVSLMFEYNIIVCPV
ncbi:sodium/potassium/calcium exchanger Nckx30C isoform X4 [Episyrphus balteatus]|uniref:sodium/potassium/calcium exchanger Nckx30C isoform X4 n=1 Tax=Episyrphus balteatus TaxID=286459 RepID=UPI002484F953|nr:sodium/potassium/calcium exchanger Nckx30C isoform X4 [Episyrphus balteatus]